MKNKFVNYFYWIGVSIVFVTHIYMLGFGLPSDQMVGHSVVNLIAGGLLAYSWFNK